MAKLGGRMRNSKRNTTRSLETPELIKKESHTCQKSFQIPLFSIGCKCLGGVQISFTTRAIACQPVRHKTALAERPKLWKNYANWHVEFSIAEVFIRFLLDFYTYQHTKKPYIIGQSLSNLHLKAQIHAKFCVFYCLESGNTLVAPALSCTWYFFWHHSPLYFLSNV